MTSAEASAEAVLLAARLAQADTELVVAAWGGTARGEMTPWSDLDLLCWNPHRTPLPELTVRHAAYLDLVTCDADQAGLREWATANATDLHAVMFARQLGREAGRSAQFADVAGSLWRDDAIRAREVYHLIATSIAVPRLRRTPAYRPEKFALGATRCWSALAECGQLAAGRSSHAGTEGNLRQLAARGMLDPRAAGAFRQAMQLRRQCEDGDAAFAELTDAYQVLGELYLACAGGLIRAVLPWLQRHAPLTPATFGRLGTQLLGATDWADVCEPRSAGEADTMIQAFLARDSAQIQRLLSQPPFRASWWIRHAAIMNPRCSPPTLRSVVDDVLRTGRWWPDRNLILYAIRHPAADEQLIARLRAVAHQLRPMDREALEARTTTSRAQGRNTRW